MFARTVSLKSTVSWVTSPIWSRRLHSVASRMSVPSMVMAPSVTS